MKYIKDITGQEVRPGNVVAISRSQQGSKSLELYIALDLKIKPGSSRGRLRLLCNKYRFNFNTKKGEHYISSTYTEVFCHDNNEIQNHIVVINNPMYCLENPNIAALIEIMMKAKSQNKLPESYVLGESLDIDESAEDEE